VLDRPMCCLRKIVRLLAILDVVCTTNPLASSGRGQEQRPHRVERSAKCGGFFGYMRSRSPFDYLGQIVLKRRGQRRLGTQVPIGVVSALRGTGTDTLVGLVYYLRLGTTFCTPLVRSILAFKCHFADIYLRRFSISHRDILWGRLSGHFLMAHRVQSRNFRAGVMSNRSISHGLRLLVG